VRAAVDDHVARAADALAAVVLERHRLLALLDQVLVEDVEHLEERHVLVRGDLVGLERARGVGARLAPDVQLQSHVLHPSGHL
jgi:hypothetical protein